MKYAKWLSVSVPADTALAYILVTDSSLFEAAECCLCWIKCSLIDGVGSVSACSYALHSSLTLCLIPTDYDGGVSILHIHMQHPCP